MDGSVVKCDLFGRVLFARERLREGRRANASGAVLILACVTGGVFFAPQGGAERTNPARQAGPQGSTGICGRPCGAKSRREPVRRLQNRQPLLSWLPITI